ncbi:MAG: beta strand repeat-containing protein [Candidatus Binatia bacterium]
MTWSTTTPAPTVTVWDPSQTAVFQAPAGTVTISDMNIDACLGMRFETDGYSLTGGSVTLTGVSSAENSISVSNAATAISNAVIGGSDGLTKIGPGTFVLGAANTFSGETVVEGGTLGVTGSASTAANTYIGYNNPTTSFSVSGGGSFSSLNAYLAVLPTSSGNTVTVSGTGSTWATTTDLAIGYQGATNALTISDDGAVTTTNGFIGYFSTSSGNSVLVSGGSWANSNVLYIGHDGSGNTFTVEDGGYAVSSNDTVVGFQSASANNGLTVKGAGSKLEIPSPFTLIIGDDGDSNTLEISNGGVITGHNARLARSANSSGNSVVVTGSGSKWTNTGTIRVGALGSGNSVTVSAGGEVSFDGNAFIGHGVAAANSAVTVTGAGSKWTGSNLVVGRASVGNVLTVSNGGTLMASAVVIAEEPGSAGTVNIGEAGPPGTFAGPVTFGAGTGLLVFNHTSTAYAFNNPIAGSGAVRHIGTGTTTLSGPNTYTGGTSSTAGTLRLGSASALPNGGPVTMNGGTLDANNHSASLGALSLQANSTLRFGNGTSTQDIVFASAAPYTGGTLLVAGLNPANDRLIITADPTASGILDHIQFSGYRVGANWEPDTGQVVPRFAHAVAPAPALSLAGAALAIAVLCALSASALRRHRRSAAD